MIQNSDFQLDLDENRLNYMSVMSSTAHTYGNLLATAEKWFLDIFPNDMFKTVHVSSQIAHRQLYTTPQQFIKKAKPMIIFRPRIEYNEDTFLQHTLITERMGGGPINSQSPGTVELNPFFFDPESNLSIEFSQMRRVMYLDITMVFNTLIQQLNVMDALRNQLVPGRPFDINTHLEALIPNSFIKVLSELSGVPVHDVDDNNCVSGFLDYMNSHSFYPVSYKLAKETGKEEFYRYYPTKIFTTVQDIDKDDGETVGHVTTSFKVTMTIRMEFWTPGITYLFSPRIKEVPPMEIPTDAALVPIYADVFDYDDLALAPGWSMYTHASFQLDKPRDDIDFRPMLKKSIDQAVEYHMKNAMPLINLIDVKVRKQGKLLSEGDDYYIDWDKRTVFFNNKDYGYYTYTIIIAIDTLYINNLLKDIYNLE